MSDKQRRPHDWVTAFDFLFLLAILAFAVVWAVGQYLDTPPYVSPTRYPVRGIDVSAHNGMMNLDAAAEDGVEFVFIKASEGVDFRDDNFRINYDKAEKAGLKIGAYHFFRFDRDGVDQAVNFLKAIDGRPLDLGVAIDVEAQGNPKDIPLDVVTMRLQDMLDYLNMKGYRVIFYTNRDGYYEFLKTNFEGYPLWICSFNSIPINAEWTFWQFNHRGRVKGIKGDVDLNTFVGNWQDWEHYLNSGELCQPADISQ